MNSKLCAAYDTNKAYAAIYKDARRRPTATKKRWQDRAQVAKRLGMESDYQFFLKHSQNYRNVFDPATGFMQPWLLMVRFSAGTPRNIRLSPRAVHGFICFA